MGMDEAPERIWAAPDTDDGWRWPVASKFPIQGYAPDGQVAYVRADLSLALGAVVMQDASLKAIMDIWAELLPKMAELELQHPAQSEIDAICAIPLPDHAALLAAALKLPEVQALVEAAKGVERWDAARGYLIPYRVRDPLRAALAPFTGGGK
jgi:hypothetical protein